MTDSSQATAAAASSISNSKSVQNAYFDPALPPCTLRRDEMACIKTALAMIVLKRRSQLSRLAPENTHKKAKFTTTETTMTTTSTAQQALAKIMGKTVSINAGSGGSGSDEGTTLDLPRRGSLQQHQKNHDQTGESLPLASTSNWASHLQHILKLTWQGMQNTPNGNHTSQWKGLCFHVACQLEQVRAAQQEELSNKEQSNSMETNVASSNSPSISDWLGIQLTSFVVTSATRDNAPLEDWVTVWKTIIQAKPIAMSELFVPVLLELLLQPVSPTPHMHPSKKKGLTAAPAALSNYNGTNHQATNGTESKYTSKTLSLEPAHLLLLFESALESAPPHVLQDTQSALSPAPQHSSVSSSSSSAIQPSANSSWYSTQDLAYDYYYLSTNATTTTATAAQRSSNSAGQICLLRHGLAAISEALTAAMASSTDQSNKTATATDGPLLANCALAGSEYTSFL